MAPVLGLSFFTLEEEDTTEAVQNKTTEDHRGFICSVFLCAYLLLFLCNFSLWFQNLPTEYSNHTYPSSYQR